MTQTKAELLQTRHQGDLKLGDADSSHYVGFKSPATVSSSLVWTLPAADGSNNHVLTTNGSGVLSWSSASSGTTINNNANDYLITGSGTANTLEAESGLQWNGALHVGTSNNTKLVLKESSQPAILFQESTTSKCFIRWRPDGYLAITNEEDSSELRIQDDLKFSVDGSTFYSILTSNSTLTSSKLSGALPAISGANLTGITTNLVSDTSPQLGGDLDVQTSEIKTATSNRNIKLNPHGTGVVEVKGDGSSNDGTIQLNCSQNSHGIKIKSPPHSASASYTFTFPNDIQNGKFLTTDGSGNTSWATAGGLSSDAQKNTVGGTNAGDSFSGTSAEQNLCLGYGAGTAITTGDDNTSLGGNYAHSLLTTGNRNTAVGTFAGYGITTGSNNVNIGPFTSYSGSTGSNHNVFVGYMSGQYTGSAAAYNTCIGMESGETITGQKNIAIGYQSLSQNTGNYCSGNDNCAIGSSTLYNISSGQYNIGIGYQAGYGIQTSDDNINIGRATGYSLTTGNNNVAIGKNACNDVTTGNYNIGIGRSPCAKVTTGDGNICVGDNSGFDLTTGSWNSLLGYSAQASSASVNNEVTLGSNNVTSLRCNVQSISSLSDGRDKTDINTLDLGLDFINSLNPVKFKWNSREGLIKDGTYEAGFIAQDLQQVQKDNNADYLGLVLDTNPDRLEASYGNLIPMLVQAVKELSARVVALEG